MSFVAKSKLPRLRREFYQGRAVVLWTHTCENRATGWLGEPFHARFREVLLHACARYLLACPVYVLMPDHWHVVWMGLERQSDQRLATAFLRAHVSAFLRHATLQDRPHDHVLRDEERTRGAFMAACEYVRMNPVRAGLVREWRDWPFGGVMLAGYPKLTPHAADFWPTFWKIYHRAMAANDESLRSRAGPQGSP